MQTLLDDDSGRLDIQHSHLGREDQLAVGGHIVSGRTKAVAVQNGSHHVSVREEDRRRAVPRLHHRRVILVEIFLLLGHGTVVDPRLRNQNHHRQRQIHAAHDQKFQRIVQHRGIGAGSADDRKDFMKFPPQILGLHGLFPGQHLVRVSLDGVDLSVVHQKTVGMRPLPARQRIGGEAGVHQRDGALIIRTLKIEEEIPELPHEEHSLVDQRPARTGHHIGVVVGLLEDPSGDVEFAVKIEPARHILRFPDKGLHDGRHLLQRLGAQNLRVRRHLSPAEKTHALFFDNDFEHLLCLIAFQFVLRQEEHADAVFPLAARLHAQRPAGLEEEFMGNLYHDPHAVAGFAFRILSGPVLQILHNAQRIFHGFMRLHAFDIDDSADSAVVVFKPRIVHSFCCTFHSHLFIHKLYPSF